MKLNNFYYNPANITSWSSVFQEAALDGTEDALHVYFSCPVPMATECIYRSDMQPTDILSDQDPEYLLVYRITVYEEEALKVFHQLNKRFS